MTDFSFCFYGLQVLSPLGNIKDALSDIKIALDLKPSAHLYLMSGTLLFMQEVSEVFR